MPDLILLEVLKEVRWKTLKLLEDVDEPQSHFTPAPLNNTILWHAGHALVVVEHLSSINPKDTLPPWPADWFDKFSWSSKPATVTQWPLLADVITRLKEQRDRLIPFVQSLTPDQLNRIVGEAPRNRTYGGMIVHACHDEANHQGEIYLLKKLWKTRV